MYKVKALSGDIKQLALYFTLTNEEFLGRSDYFQYFRDVLCSMEKNGV